MSERGLPTVEVDFHGEPREYTVTDGMLWKPQPGQEKYDLLEFPGVAVCVPVVITRGSEVMAAIHVNPRWNVNMLEEEIAELKREGATTVKYVERVNAADQKEGEMRQVNMSKNRQEILDWLKSDRVDIPVERSSVVADSPLDHFGYDTKRGFVLLDIK